MMVAVSQKKLDINSKYLGKLADIKIRVPSDEENGIPDYRKVIKDYAAQKGMSVNQLVIELINDSMKKDGYNCVIPSGIKPATKKE